MDIKEHGSTEATFILTNGACHSSRTVKAGTRKAGHMSTSEAWTRSGLYHHIVRPKYNQQK